MFSTTHDVDDEICGMPTDDGLMIEKVILGAHERRIARLEEGFGSIVQTVTKIEADVRQTNVLASDLCRDTRDIRDMVAGAKTVGRVIAWGVAITGGALGILVALYALGWVAK